jgi:hypothetical protein
MMMSNDPRKLIDGFSSAWNISDEEQELLLTNTTGQRESLEPAPRQKGTSSYPVGIATVSTFIAQKNMNNFVVPSFATHWGVVCDFTTRSRTLYHLTFNSDTQVVRFKGETWTPEWNHHQVKQVGTSLYGYPEIHETGNNAALP